MKMVKAIKFTITDMEGTKSQIDKFKGIEVKTWEEINALLEEIARTMPDEIGVLKTFITVEFLDGFKWEAKYEVNPISRGSPDLGKHITDFLLTHSGKKKPEHLTEKQYQEYLKAHDFPQEEFSKILEKYNILVKRERELIDLLVFLSAKQLSTIDINAVSLRVLKDLSKKDLLEKHVKEEHRTITPNNWDIPRQVKELQNLQETLSKFNLVEFIEASPPLIPTSLMDVIHVSLFTTIDGLHAVSQADPAIYRQLLSDPLIKGKDVTSKFLGYEDHIEQGNEFPVHYDDKYHKRVNLHRSILIDGEELFPFDIMMSVAQLLNEPRFYHVPDLLMVADEKFAYARASVRVEEKVHMTTQKVLDSLNKKKKSELWDMLAEKDETVIHSIETPSVSPSVLRKEKVKKDRLILEIIMRISEGEIEPPEVFEEKLKINLKRFDDIKRFDIM